MTAAARLIERLRRERVSADAADVRRLLEASGWTFAGQRGSHVRFTKQGQPSIVYPLKHGREVRAVYVRQILKRVTGD